MSRTSFTSIFACFRAVTRSPLTHLAAMAGVGVVHEPLGLFGSWGGKKSLTEVGWQEPDHGRVKDCTGRH